jgi:hypothetical protein
MSNIQVPKIAYDTEGYLAKTPLHNRTDKIGPKLTAFAS